MHSISKSVIVPYSAEKMYQLVNQIEDYPQFLNWCSDACILKQSPTEITALLKIDKAALSQSFTTINTLTANKRIEIRLKDGAFSHLYGVWLFKKLNDEACKIELNLEFSFRSPLMDFTFAPIFSKIASSQLDAFVSRAEQVYR